MTITDKADTIQSRYNATLKQVRDNKHLSDEGRRAAIAKAFRAAKRDMTATRENHDTDIRGRRSQLVAKAYGHLPSGSSGYDVIAYRDAIDRVANLKNPREAMNLLARAEQSGDKGLAAAIAQHAETLTEEPLKGKEWTSVIQAYVDARPHLEETFGELTEIDNYLARGAVHNGLLFNISVPEEIRDVAYNPTRLDAVADSA